MKILLDTCIFLWFISCDRQLSKMIRESICDPDNDVFLSSVSIWECIVKYQLGKLPLPESPNVYLPAQRKLHRISSLSLDESSVTQLSKLPSVHRDPFDRMLICQALDHNMVLATVDDIMRSYPVKTL